MLLGKSFIFDAAHFIEGHVTCGTLHGHTWTLTVMVKGTNLQPNGMLLDFKVLGGVVKDHINRELDHKTLNTSLSGKLSGPITAETLAQYLANYYATTLVNLGLADNLDSLGVRLQEGLGGWAETWNSFKEEYPNG